MLELSLIMWALSLLSSLVLLYLAFEVACGLRPLKQIALSSGPASKSVILVPAHDEEDGIFDTVASLRANRSAGCSILVVADNCSDRTAARAREAGADVIERHDPERRGKGYALSFGREYLRQDPPAVVVVVDADCRLTPGSEQRLAARVLDAGAPVQAINLVFAGANASPLVQISNFAMLVKNVVRARGLQRVGGGVLLFGTGMAFPWSVFADAPLATADVVEDMQLGLSLARAGVRVQLEEGARVSSEAAAVSESAGQRRRWEHGFLRAATTNAAPLILEGLKQRSMHRFALGMHLLVPPLALLFLVTGAVFTGLCVAAATTNLLGPAILTGVSLAAASFMLLIAWAVSGRQVLSARALLAIPFYACWKIPIYIGFFISRQTGWNRTKRRDASAPAANDTRS